MTDTSKLIERLRTVASHLRQDPHGNPIEAGVNRHRAATVEEGAAKITNLEARLRLAEKRADDAEARNDFLIKELDKLIEKARQS